MIESEEDRLGYLTAFGSEWSTANGSLWAIFDNQPVELQSDLNTSRAGVLLTQPVLTCRTSDVVSRRIEEGAVMSNAAGERYTVKYLTQDGTGMSRIIMRS